MVLPLAVRLLHARSLMLAVVVLGLVAAGWSWARVAQTIAGAKPAVAPGHVSAIVWANRVFDSRADFRRWLRSRGSTYVSWRQRYPAAAAVLEHRPAQPPRTFGVAAALSNKHAAAPSVSASSHGHFLRDALMAMLVAAALLCAAAAALPEQVLARSPALARRVVPHRELLLAGATALGAGLLVGAVFT